MCLRCEELEERVAWLEGELGLVSENEQFRLLRTAMLAPSNSRSRVGRAAAVNLVLALYRARGRTLSRPQLLDAIPSPSGNSERLDTIINVWVCFARRCFGNDAIESVWGKGYRLTDSGMTQVAAILEPGRIAA